jgi:hypothetical protein
MAQTKRKRRTKHRGTAAGTIERRGRTGRPSTAEEKRKAQRQTVREQRLNQPPTWKGSFAKAALAATLMFVFVLLTSKPKNGNSPLPAALTFAVLAMVIYVPAGYYLELFMYRRRQARKARAK